MSVLSLNAGSSSLKFALFDRSAQSELTHGIIDWRGGSGTATLSFRSSGHEETQSSLKNLDYGEAVIWILRSLTDQGFEDPIEMVGHRVVHGGTEFTETTRIDKSVWESLAKISHLAPLHNPPALATIKAASKALPDAAQFAVFDTAFFASLPRRATIYPVPFEWFEKYGIRRFGFHGISHSYCASRAATLLERQDDANFRLVVCHLGNGCSATAVRGGQPIETTMGFTPLEGLMMGTRSGSIDPGILLHLLREGNYDADRLYAKLNQDSGLRGVSGVSSDFREVEREANAGNSRAQLAIELFTDRIRSTIGALAATLGGVDALVFTAGIGENSAPLRSKVCHGLQCVNLHLDEEKNHGHPVDRDIAKTDSLGRILVLRTREEQMIAHESCRLFTSGS